MCVVDACMVCIEGGGVITALHHQITNLTHHHQIHQRDARAEERYAITSRTFAVKWMILMAAHSTTSHWEQLVHSCFQRRAEPRKTACHVSSANCGSFNATRALPLRALCHESTHLGAVAVISRNSGAMSVFAFDPPPWLLMNVTAWRPQRTFGHFVVVVTIRRTTCAADKCPTLIRRTSLGKSRIPTESDIWIVFSLDLNTVQTRLCWKGLNGPKTYQWKNPQLSGAVNTQLNKKKSEKAFLATLVALHCTPGSMGRSFGRA